MTADQFNRALTKLGFTQVAFAELLDVSDRMVRRWASDRWPVPKPIAMLLNLMLKTGSTEKDLKP